MTGVEAGSDPRTEAEAQLVAERTFMGGDAAGNPDPVVDGATWGPERMIRAEFLAAILTDGEREPVFVRGARVVQSLTLASMSLPVPFFLEYCRFDQLIVLDLADAGRISLNGSFLADGISARGLRTRGNIALLDATSHGTIWLAGADIGGTIVLNDADLSPAQYTNADGSPSDTTALFADHVRVREDVLCGGTFESSGRLLLRSASIGGSLLLNGARLTGAGWSLDAAGAEVGRNLHCQGDKDTNRAYVGGPLKLVDARIEGSFNCAGASIEARGEEAAVLADRAEVGAGVHLRGGFSASGMVSLQRAKIHGDLDFTSAQLDGAPHALLANDAHVDGNAFLRRGFSARGTVNLAGVHVGGQLSLVGASISADVDPADPYGRALNLQGADVATGIIIQAAEMAGMVDLSSARTRTFNDDEASWPSAGQLRVEGFRYEQFGIRLSPEKRLDWLARNDIRYVPDAFDQLAASFTRSGDEESARKVLIEKQRVRRDRVGVIGVFTNAWSRFLDISVGYGYRPGRAFLLLLVLWTVGSIAIGTVFADDIVAASEAARAAPLRPPLYTLDLLLPVASLGQRAGWVATGAAAWFTTALTVLGWLFGLTLVAAVTGVFRRI